MRDAWRGAALVLPATAFTVLFFLMPTGVIVIWSLFRKETGRLVTDVSLDNYVRAFGQDIYFNALVNSVDLVADLSIARIGQNTMSPKARGPNSARPCARPTIRPRAIAAPIVAAGCLTLVIFIRQRHRANRFRIIFSRSREDPKKHHYLQ